jgi:hypothetical protein
LRKWARSENCHLQSAVLFCRTQSEFEISGHALDVDPESAHHLSDETDFNLVKFGKRSKQKTIEMDDAGVICQSQRMTWRTIFEIPSGGGGRVLNCR